MDPAIYIETDVPPGITLDEWRTRAVRPERNRSLGRLKRKGQRVLVPWLTPRRR